MSRRIVIIGAGMGGLAAALELSSRGFAVEVVESAPSPGGKMRQVFPAGRPIDAGPTVFTMRRVFDELLHFAGTSLEAELKPRRLEILARHAWDVDGKRGERFDLFADIERSVEAIGAFAGREDAAGFRRLTEDAARMFRTLDESFMRAQKPGPVGLLMSLGPARWPDLWATRPFSTYWSSLGGYFRDPRLRQLFGRYATYNGSNPFLAPATLMLIAHAEMDGVWALDGGMHALATCFQRLAEKQGARFTFGTRALEIRPATSGPHEVRLSNGEALRADAIVFNGDVSALRAGLLGLHGKPTPAPTERARRSLSALTWCLDAPTEGFPLTLHNVFFSDDYEAEFRALQNERKPPTSPTVYVCAQDRNDTADTPARDRLLCLINAPADADHAPMSETEIEKARHATFALMERCGLKIDLQNASTVHTGPAEFASLFPASGGALYGAATHGPFATFRRAGARTRIPGLYLCGGSVHPSAGVPMAAQSGRLAAASIVEDLR